MNVTIMVPQDVDVKILRVDAGVRYWEDGLVDGLTDDENLPSIPFSQSGRWRIDIDIDKGMIVGWPDVEASVHYKVCDDGVYTLLDSEGRIVKRLEGEYVPNVLCPEESGYGDYIIMNINNSGHISGWDKTQIKAML